MRRFGHACVIFTLAYLAVLLCNSAPVGRMQTEIWTPAQELPEGLPTIYGDNGTITVPPHLLGTSDAELWGYGFGLALTLIVLTITLSGVAVKQCMRKPFFKQMRVFLVALAVAMLFSTAVFHFIPEALGLDPKEVVFQCCVIFGGAYMFWFTGQVLKLQKQKPKRREGAVDLGVALAGDAEEGLPGTKAPQESQSTEETGRAGGACSWLKGTAYSDINTVAWMIVLGDGLHNVIDGMAVAASFKTSVSMGFSTTVAILCEESTHELGDVVILLKAGMTIQQALFFNFLSACACYPGFVFGVLAMDSFSPTWIFALAAGMFLYIALACLLPEMHELNREDEEAGGRRFLVVFGIQNAGLLTGFALILLLTLCF